MVGILSRMSGMFDFWAGHRRLLAHVQQLEQEREGYDKRIDELTRATMDGEDKWFLDLVKKDPSCAMRIVEECRKEDA